MIERAKSSCSFCIYPFTHLATKTDGSFKLCCRSLPISNVQKESATEVWNGDTYKRIRREMLSGQRSPECVDCWQLEDVGTRSMRQRALSTEFEDSRWNRYSELLRDCSEDGVMPTLPKTIEMKISNLCNLKCRMCSPLDSSSWVSEWPVVEDLMLVHNTWAYDTAREVGVLKNPLLSTFEDSDDWWLEFDKLVDHLDMIEFAGGEPLMDPLHYRILSLLERRADKIRLKYSTNLTRMTFKGQHIFEHWKKFAGVSVYASIDGIFDVYDYIRTGAKFSEVSKNLMAVAENREVKFEEVAVACTIQVYNVFQLPQMIEYFHERGIKFHTHRVTYPNFLNVQVLPQDVKDRLSAEIRQYQATEPKSNSERKARKAVNKHLVDHLNFMNGRDESHLLPALREYTSRLDAVRKTDAGLLHPELAKILAPAPVQSPAVTAGATDLNLG